MSLAATLTAIDNYKIETHQIDHDLIQGNQHAAAKKLEKQRNWQTLFNSVMSRK